MSDYKKTANFFKAISDENRLRIIELLKSGEKCACHISDSLSISQPKLSYHMKILCECEIVSCYYTGKWTNYKLNKNGFTVGFNLLEQLHELPESDPDKHCECSMIAI